MLTGAVSGGVAKYAGIKMFGVGGVNFSEQLIGHAIIGGVTGGITAELYGGSFRRGFKYGAMTGAIGLIANKYGGKGLSWLSRLLGIKKASDFISCVALTADLTDLAIECRKEFNESNTGLLGSVEFCNKYGGEEVSDYWCRVNCVKAKLIEIHGDEYSRGAGKKWLEHCIKASY